MVHPQLLEIRTLIIYKADDPTWFKSVLKSEKEKFKMLLRGLVQQKADRVLLMQMEGGHELSINEQQHYQTMLTYLHNGNQAKYEKYKTKTREAMSEILTFLMEQESLTAAFVADESQNPSIDIVHNEQAALRKGKAMKNFADNLEYYDAKAEYVELYK